jgi:surface polysaccharide O-acyltransferase-like enzyme
MSTVRRGGWRLFHVAILDTSGGAFAMRKYYIDRLRNLGILFLFPYHTARVFNDNPSFYVKGYENAFSSVLVYSSSFWFMPLLFLVSGMSSFYALSKRSARSYIGERFSRLLVPFAFGCVFIVPPQAYYALKFQLDYQGGYPEFLKRYFTDFSGWTETTGISPAHLWFLLFLFIISVALLPLMRTVVTRRYSPAWLRRPRPALLPFAVPAVLSFLPALGGQNIFVYGMYFMLGFLIATDDEIVTMIEDHRRINLAIALTGTTGFLIEIYSIGKQTSPLFAAWHYLFFWAALLAILGYGKRYLNRRSRFMDYFGPAAFPVYIVHQTFLVVIAYYVLRITDRGIVPFALILLLSFGLSLATYEVIRRMGPLRFLFGVKTARATAGPPRPPAAPTRSL